MKIIMEMNRNRLLAIMLALSCGPMIATTALAQLQLEIAKSPDATAPKIAIVPFDSDQKIYTIVENDLNHSGKFTSASKNLPTISSLNNVDANSWTNTGIPYVVVGKVSQPDPNSYQIHYQLFDVEKKQFLLNEVLTAPVPRVRQAGHAISDAIYQALTGIPGSFSGRIAYVLRNPNLPNQRYTLQIADTDGERPVTVMSSHYPILSPAWTPDGKSIGYVSFETKRPRIYLQDLSTGQRQVLTNYPGLNGAPSFSPDGKSMLFTGSMDGNPDIYQMNLETRQIERLTKDSAIDTEARYTPDGKSFIFTSDRGGTPQVYRYNFDNGTTQRLTFRGTFNARSTLSADGRKLAMVSRQSGNNFKIAIQDLSSSVYSVITPTSLDESPSFSPNGQMVVYATQEGNRGLLSIISLNGQFKMNLPSEQGEVREPAWAPK